MLNITNESGIKWVKEFENFMKPFQAHDGKYTFPSLGRKRKKIQY